MIYIEYTDDKDAMKRMMGHRGQQENSKKTLYFVQCPQSNLIKVVIIINESQ